MVFLRRRAPAITYPGLSGRKRVYAVGDIHGCLAELEALLQLIDADRRDEGGNQDEITEVYLGDYVDRGPDSKAVIDRMIARAAEVDAVFLAGNHEQMLVEALCGSLTFDTWCRVGGYSTLLSYGIGRDLIAAGDDEMLRAALAERLPPDHVEFLEKLRDFWVADDYCFVHAGLRPGVPLERQDRSDLLWIREPAGEDALGYDHVVVHGHTPMDAPLFRPRRIGIDTGAFATGRLTCLRVDRHGARILATTDRARRG